MLLKNVRVLDLSQYIPGPYVTRLLADLGAQIIKVEPPAGDPMRNFSVSADDQISMAYVALNRGKKIVRLDLKNNQEVLKLKTLLVDADVLIDGFRPATLDRFELDRDTINQINPNLIHCALTGFGQTGPKAFDAGHDLGYCAVAGMLSISGAQKKPPLTYPPLADHVGALQASNSILAALYSRTLTGKGVFIDASLYEPVLAWQYMTQSEFGRQVLGGEAAYYNIYQTGDGKFLTLSALEKKFWRHFCQAINKPDWIDRHADELPQQKLKGELGDFFLGMTAEQINQLLADADCCYEPVAEPEDVNTHPHTSMRGIVNHYPNLINGEALASSQNLNEITEIKNIAWD